MVSIKVKRLHPGAHVPRYAHTGDYGDLAADIYASQDVVLAAHGHSHATHAVPTGLAFEFPPTHGALVEDRSGLALQGITTLAGVIDPGYRGELKIVLTNLGPAPIAIKAGERIAQLRIVQRIQAEFEEVHDVADTKRGEGGFGSTGR